ncbi:MAG: N-acetylmuramoyl-L-alanine amidase [Endomicrobium sp.]|jgi:N-acetylmuramoyl-L-alanine amidase|nr:N-acetylmuramoyl-L-alanine amidase [Endomicrobium sp.]
MHIQYKLILLVFLILFINPSSIYSDLLYTKEKLVVIDAGHGGRDPGAIGNNNTKEKDITLDIAKKLKNLFETKKGYKVILTRNNDIFIKLNKRTEIANMLKANLFMSIHCNSSYNKNANGFEVYFLSKKDIIPNILIEIIVENFMFKFNKNHSIFNISSSININKYENTSFKICNSIIDEIADKIKIKIRGIKQANFCILSCAKVPAILIETAFLSNETQEIILNSEKFRNELAKAIYNGVIKYFTYASKSKKQIK